MNKNLLLLFVLFLNSFYLPSRLLGEQSETKVDLLERCQECKLFLVDQKNIRGQLINLGDDHLVIAVRDGPLTRKFQDPFQQRVVHFEEVLQMRCGDPIWDGCVWGFLAGGFIGATFMGIKYGTVSDVHEPGYDYGYALKKIVLGFLVGGGAGMLLGGGIDEGNGYPEETRDIHEWLEEKEH
ncbi:MAG: hypothetical protein ACYS9T_07830 [Planctomycetota bacterium]|jgi:hypothetical protein